MFLHSLGIAAAIAAIILVTILPFLPGTYDTLAAPLSMMARVFGYVGLLLVPVGAVWVASAYWTGLARWQYASAVVALIASSIVAILVSLAGLVFSGALLTACALAIWVYAASRAVARLRRWHMGAPHRSAAGCYLLIVPAAVLPVQMALLPRAIEFSRNRAIENSGRLIAAIEQYRNAYGRYPESLLSVHEDIHPGVMGIERYLYEPRGDAYNVLFEQSALHFGTREFVMYNPRDVHAFTSHKRDRLELTPAQLALDQTRGHNALHDAKHPHWKYFWFD